MFWIDNGEQGNHGIGLGMLVWNGISIMYNAIERDGSGRKKCHGSVGVKLMLFAVLLPFGCRWSVRRWVH